MSRCLKHFCKHAHELQDVLTSIVGMQGVLASPGAAPFHIDTLHLAGVSDFKNQNLRSHEGSSFPRP